MITTVNLSLSQAENGVLLRFPAPANLRSGSQYILYFDAPVSLPETPANTISFQPNNGSYYISGSNNSQLTVVVSIKSLHKAQTKTLIRLVIKDINNNTIDTNYMLVVCSPSSESSFSGKILAAYTGNFGPNGGRLLQIIGGNQATSTVSIGDIVQGPGIPDTLTVTIRSILSSSTLELNTKPIPTALSSNSTPFEIGGQEFSGTYTIIREIGCIDPTSSNSFQLQSEYTVLDQYNNWSYKVRDQILAQFILDDKENNSDCIVLLPIKNTSLLADKNEPNPIPAVSVVKIAGRAGVGTIPVTDL